MVTFTLFEFAGDYCITFPTRWNEGRVKGRKEIKMKLELNNNYLKMTKNVNLYTRICLKMIGK